MAPQINQAGLSLIENFEGLRLEAYDDGTGVWTIGYGHTSGVHPGMAITKEQAQAFLESDLRNAEACVNEAINRSLTPNQYAACVSFTFNLGGGAFQGSTLLKKINAGDFAGAADEFLKWVYAGGQRLEGLVRRREAERALFLTA